MPPTRPTRPTRTLLLLRHAKSSWDDPSLDDFDRPLAPRGRRDAPRMGELLRHHGWHPDTVLCSPSARTRETWAAVAERLPSPDRVSFPGPLYHATPADLLDLIRGLPDGASTAMIVGHNPGMAETVRMLAAEGRADRADARAGRADPTGRSDAADAGDRAAGAAGVDEGLDRTPRRAKELRRLRKKVPTAALAVFEVPGSWDDVGAGGVLFQRFIRPKDL